MPPNQPPPAAERNQTDESLRVEREVADQALGDEQSGIDELADAVITRARLRADQVLAAARAKSDRRTGQGAPGAGLPSATDIASARADEDRVVRKERAAADNAVSGERAEQSSLLSLERKMTDDDLSRERHRADAALAVRDEFLGIVSHDLRNMLNSIMLSATLIEEGAGREPAAQLVQHAQRIRRGGARMNRLVGDLIDVASIQAGALAVTCERTDAALVVAEAIETFQVQATGNGVSLQAELIAPLTECAFDPARILQVLSNLLSNALKFSARGGKVVVRAERRGAELTMTVADTGAGIPADKLEIIFERFLQLKGNDRRGLGLGLYISKCIVQGHGGRIWAESHLGAGSKFFFTLPQPPIEAAPSARGN
ncbi:MAG: HAMP domain-containing histidine kinase [Myxococcales bacterium]|nr:HAMP domain-containing histidine kinase [Myxococcales bacterium]